MAERHDRQTKLAEALAEARRTGGCLDHAELTPPADLDEAYAVAAEVTERLGGRVAGWKIGATSARAQSFLGLEQPFWGAVLEQDLLASPAVLAGLGAPFEAEPEIAFRLRRDLPGDVTPEQAVAAVEPLFALEVNRPSFAEPFAAGALLLIVDKGVNRALVLGPTLPAGLDPAEAGLTLVVDGEPLGETTPRASGFDPLEALLWLARDKARRGGPLRAGQVVATGSVGRAAALHAGRTAAVLHEGREVLRLQVMPSAPE